MPSGFAPPAAADSHGYSSPARSGQIVRTAHDFDHRVAAPGALNKRLDLSLSPVFTGPMTAERMARSDRATGTREAILSAAEVLFAERGMYAVSNRQISEAAGQGNNAAACYHFGTRTDLLRAIESRHREPIEELRAQMLADIGDSTELRDWVGALVRPLTDHLTALGVPSCYAR